MSCFPLRLGREAGEESQPLPSDPYLSPSSLTPNLAPGNLELKGVGVPAVRPTSAAVCALQGTLWVSRQELSGITKLHWAFGQRSSRLVNENTESES